jgi:hypothetical protein
LIELLLGPGWCASLTRAGTAWERHFRWNGPYLIGRTAIGRVTVEVLAMNDPLRVAVREELIAEGVLPPE